VIIGIHDGLTWVGPSQILRRTWTVDVVLGATVGGEVGGLMDERSSIGVVTGGWGGPEGTAEVDLPELVGVDVSEVVSPGAGTVVGEARELAATDQSEVVLNQVLASWNVGTEPGDVSTRAPRDIP